MATNRRAKKKLGLYPKSLVTMGVNSNASEALRKLEKLIKEKVLRSAAYAGARVFYDEMRIRVPYGEGTLHDSIYHYHMDSKSNDKIQMYAIGPNKKKAPHWYNVEYGHWLVNVVHYNNGNWMPTKTKLPQPKWIPGTPYVRPTYTAKQQAAIDAMQIRFAQRLKEVINEVNT